MALPLVFAVDGPAAAQDNGCVSGREAQQAVEARRILSFDRAATAEGYSPEDIVSQSGLLLCDVDGRPHWKVNIRDKDGNYSTVDLPAQGD
ncbi:MAG: hypothetical protein ACYC0C_18240 [Devosia sp.]